MRSTYRWQGQVETSDEVLLLIKTTDDRLAALTARVQALHPYELPEVVAVEARGGLPRTSTGWPNRPETMTDLRCQTALPRPPAAMRAVCVASFALVASMSSPRPPRRSTKPTCCRSMRHSCWVPTPRRRTASRSAGRSPTATTCTATTSACRPMPASPRSRCSCRRARPTPTSSSAGSKPTATHWLRHCPGAPRGARPRSR